MKENKVVQDIHKMPATLRLLISLAFAGVAFFITRSNSSSSIQFMISWVTFALVNLVLFYITILTASPDEIKGIAKKQDSSRALIFLVVLIASFISLFAIVLLLRTLPDNKEAGHYFSVALSIASVISSWILIHTIFTFRYAHLFYTCKTEEAGIQKEHMGGLIFPNDEEPDYMDFAYFAFVIGMTFQVSDVQISSSQLRRVALLHGLLSFMFNTVILALSINIISGLVKQ